MKVGNQNKIIAFISFIFFAFLSCGSFALNRDGNIVTLGALDKITAKFSEFEINVGQSAEFGSLNIKIYKCLKRPPEEIPEDFVLLRIDDEINQENPVMVFSGWMLSSSPSLSTLEHPTYDIWVKDCS